MQVSIAFRKKINESITLANGSRSVGNGPVNLSPPNRNFVERAPQQPRQPQYSFRRRSYNPASRLSSTRLSSSQIPHLQPDPNDNDPYSAHLIPLDQIHRGDVRNSARHIPRLRHNKAFDSRPALVDGE